MTTPTFTTPPTSPSRSDPPATFVSRANAFAAWIVTFVAEMVAAVAWLVTTAATVAADALAATVGAASAAASATAALTATGYMRRSTATLAIGTGAKAVTGLNAPSAAAFANDDVVTLIDAENPDNRMWGTVSAANMGAGTMTVTVGAGQFVGSGSPDSWIVILRAFETLLPATVAQIRAGSSNATTVTPANLMSAMAFTALTYGGTVNWDLAVDGWNVSLTFAGNPTIAAPTNLHDGLGVSMALIQGAGGNAATWNSIFDWGGDGAPTLSAGAGKVDFVFGIYKASTGKIHMTFRRAA